MKLHDCRLLTDENIHGVVVIHLRKLGFDILDVREQGLSGAADRDLLRLAESQNRVVVTYDSDFGALVIRGGEAVYGILFIRPGDLKADQVIETLDTMLNLDTDLDPPFIVTVKRVGQNVNVRVRDLGKTTE